MCAHATGSDPSHHGPKHITGPSKHRNRRRQHTHQSGGNSRSSPGYGSDSMRVSADSDANISDSSDNTNEVEMEIDDPNFVRIGIIADNEVTLGFLLAGIGCHRDRYRNYLMVDNDMALEEIEHFFNSLYRRHNIGIILLDYSTARRLHSLLEKCNQMLPVVIIIPTKVSILPYLEEKERLRRQRQREIYQ